MLRPTTSGPCRAHRRRCASLSMTTAMQSPRPIPPAARRPGRRAMVDAGHMLTGVSCSSSIRCVAVDDHGNVLSSTGPTGGATSWAATHVDGGQDLYGAYYGNGIALTGVSCPSDGRCVAVDDAGNAVDREHARTRGDAPVILAVRAQWMARGITAEPRRETGGWPLRAACARGQSTPRRSRARRARGSSGGRAPGRRPPDGARPR